jgi:hypothetical protein
MTTEDRIQAELARIVDSIRQAKKDDDIFTENYWQDVWNHVKPFAERVTGKTVTVKRWHVTLTDTTPKGE